MSADGSLFYKSNIHERRVAAFVCRAAPAISVITITATVLYGAFNDQIVLLWVTAIFNVSLWLWVVTTAMQCIHATLYYLVDLEQCPTPEPKSPGSQSYTAVEVGGGGGTGECVQFGNSVQHMIVLPNYKEDESMLAETLRSLAEAADSKSFWIVLAMEEREGEAGRKKADRLKFRFKKDFARIVISIHPGDLVENHQDGSENAEVPGKASNVKYAVDLLYRECSDLGVHHDVVLLTVADADSIFHPLYFERLSMDFCRIRATNAHKWTMWCPPQFPYRNFGTSPIVSRVWGYIQSTYEFGGLSGTVWGGHHMAFSTYSLPITLAQKAEAWDGDAIAEDHHASLKCFYYWLHTVAAEAQKHSMWDWTDTVPRLQLRPIFLPVKSTSVSSEPYWRSWVERWHQAKRHAQGVSELSYALLATYDAFRTCLIPKKIFNVSLYTRLVQVVLRLWCMHVLPIVQGICLVVLTAKWLQHRGNLSLCPDRVWFFGDLRHWAESEQYVLCGVAGAWVLTWPVVIPWILIVVSNILLIHRTFVRPAMLNRCASLWHSEDGQVADLDKGTFHVMMRIIFTVSFDCIFGMSWILLPYGAMVELIAYFNVLVSGNLGFTYVTAAKGVSSQSSAVNYGAMEDSADRNAVELLNQECSKKQTIMIA